MKTDPELRGVGGMEQQAIGNGFMDHKLSPGLAGMHDRPRQAMKKNTTRQTSSGQLARNICL